MSPKQRKIKQVSLNAILQLLQHRQETSLHIKILRVSA